MMLMPFKNLQSDILPGTRWNVGIKTKASIFVNTQIKVTCIFNFISYFMYSNIANIV